jgi:hypothetical protein
MLSTIWIFFGLSNLIFIRQLRKAGDSSGYRFRNTSSKNTVKSTSLADSNVLEDTKDNKMPISNVELNISTINN